MIIVEFFPENNELQEVLSEDMVPSLWLKLVLLLGLEL